MRVEQTKIVVKSQKRWMSAERKSAGRTTPICSEGQPGMSKNAIGGGQLICGSPGLRPPTFELVAAPAQDRGRARRPIFCRLNGREVVLNFTRSARRDSSPL